MKSRGKVSWGTVLGKLSEGEVNRGNCFGGSVVLVIEGESVLGELYWWKVSEGDSV